MHAPCTPHHHEPVLRLFLSIRTTARSVFRLSHHRKLLSDLSNVQRSVGTFQVFKCWGSSRLAGATSSSALWEKNVSIFDLVWSQFTLLPNWSPGVELHHDLPSQLTSIKGGRLEYGAFSGLESESTLVACWREMFTFILHKIFEFAIKTIHPLQKKWSEPWKVHNE